MIGTNLVSLIKSFSSGEMKLFEKFILSPYFNSVKNYISLFRVIRKFYPEFTDENFTSEYVYSKVFKRKPFNKQVMWNITSGLEKLAREFLIHRTLDLNHYYKHDLLLMSLGPRNISKYFRFRLNEFEKFSESLLIGEDIETGIDYFKVKWKISTFNGIYAHLLGRLELIKEGPAKRSWYLICSFMEHLTQDLYNMYFLERTYNVTFDLKIPLLFIKQLNLKKVIDEVKNSQYEDTWILEFYHHKIMCLLQNDGDEYFYGLRKTFIANHKRFTKGENYNTAATLTNYCLDKISEGKLKYRAILFELNKFRLSENLFLVGNAMRKTLYMQILNTALSINKIDWATQFVNYYTKYLNKDLQASVEALAKAYIYFEDKKYNNVLESLNNVEFIDITDKIHVKNLIAKTYYEMKEFELLSYQIDSAKRFLKNNKNISDNLREVNVKFFNYLRSILAADEKRDSSKLIKMEENIRNDNAVNYKNWLLEKLAETKKI